MTRYVPIDLHRHRSVVMQMTADGEVAGWTRLANDPEALVAEVLLDAGEEDVEVAIEATYGWYWAVDTLQAAGGRGPFGGPVAAVGVRGPPGQERPTGLPSAW
jgi:hypothetical protein